MNSLEYSDGAGVSDPWPVGADRTGATLAKVNAQAASDDPANWSVSNTLGGTAGQRNFVAVGSIDRTTIVPLNQQWRFDQSGRDFGTQWRDPTFDDTNWSSGRALFFHEDAELSGPKNTPLDTGRATHYFRTTFDFRGDPSHPSKLVF